MCVNGVLVLAINLYYALYMDVRLLMEWARYIDKIARASIMTVLKSVLVVGDWSSQTIETQHVR